MSWVGPRRGVAALERRVPAHHHDRRQPVPVRRIRPPARRTHRRPTPARLIQRHRVVARLVDRVSAGRVVPRVRRRVRTRRILRRAAVPRAVVRRPIRRGVGIPLRRTRYHRRAIRPRFAERIHPARAAVLIDCRGAGVVTRDRPAARIRPALPRSAGQPTITVRIGNERGGIGISLVEGVRAGRRERQRVELLQADGVRRAAAGVKRNPLQSFVAGNSAAKSLGPVPSTGPGERLRTTLFVTTPPLKKSGGGDLCPSAVWAGRFRLGLRREKNRRPCASLRRGSVSRP